MWKVIEGSNGSYSVSDIGEVRRNHLIRNVISRNGTTFTRTYEEQLLSQTTTIHGYKKVHLRIDGKRSTHSVHRLVANAYIDNPNNYLHINHKNGNKIDNKVSNLEWCTASENTIHAYDNKLMIHNNDIVYPILPLDIVMGIRIDYVLYGLNATKISNKYKLAKRYIWDIISWKRYGNIGTSLQNSMHNDCNGKLRSLDILEIKRLYTKFSYHKCSEYGPRKLARMFNISYGTLVDIINGKSWNRVHDIPLINSWNELINEFKSSGLPSSLILLLGDSPVNIYENQYNVYYIDGTSIPNTVTMNDELIQIESDIYCKRNINGNIISFTLFRYNDTEITQVEWLCSNINMNNTTKNHFIPCSQQNLFITGQYKGRSSRIYRLLKKTTNISNVKVSSLFYTNEIYTQLVEDEFSNMDGKIPTLFNELHIKLQSDKYNIDEIDKYTYWLFMRSTRQRNAAVSIFADKAPFVSFILGSDKRISQFYYSSWINNISHESILSQSHISYIVNLTNIPFILPYSYKSDIIVLTPCVLAKFNPKSDINNSDIKVHICTEDKCNWIQNINHFLYTNSDNYVASGDESVLKWLISTQDGQNVQSR